MDHPAVPMKIRRGIFDLYAPAARFFELPGPSKVDLLFAIHHAAPCATAAARIVVPRQLSQVPHCSQPGGSPRALRRKRVRHSAVCAYTTICSSFPWSRCLRCSYACASGSSGVLNTRALSSYRRARRSTISPSCLSTRQHHSYFARGNLRNHRTNLCEVHRRGTRHGSQPLHQPDKVVVRRISTSHEKGLQPAVDALVEQDAIGWLIVATSAPGFLVSTRPETPADRSARRRGCPADRCPCRMHWWRR